MWRMDTPSGPSSPDGLLGSSASPPPPAPEDQQQPASSWAAEEGWGALMEDPALDDWGYGYGSGMQDPAFEGPRVWATRSAFAGAADEYPEDFSGSGEAASTSEAGGAWKNAKPPARPGRK